MEYRGFQPTMVKSSKNSSDMQRKTDGKADDLLREASRIRSIDRVAIRIVAISKDQMHLIVEQREIAAFLETWLRTSRCEFALTSPAGA